jgi:hypothetical protein
MISTTLIKKPQHPIRNLSKRHPSLFILRREVGKPISSLVGIYYGASLGQWQDISHRNKVTFPLRLVDIYRLFLPILVSIQDISQFCLVSGNCWHNLGQLFIKTQIVEADALKFF